MARSPDELVRRGSELLQVLDGAIAEMSATEWALFERYGETTAIRIEISKLGHFREKLSAFSRLGTLLLRLCTARSGTDPTVLDLLEQTIERTDAILAVSQANLLEIRRIWQLL